MSRNDLHADAVATLARWAPPEPDQDSLRQSFLGFLAACPEAMTRACVPGHVTASTLVFDSALRQVLLTLHPRVGRWLQLGGHHEDDVSIAAAAHREATEESGIDGLTVDPEPVRLAVHPITCSLGVPTRHFDVQFVAVAPAGATPICSSESLDLRWWPIDGLPASDDTFPMLVDAGLRRLGRPASGRRDAPADHIPR